MTRPGNLLALGILLLGLAATLVGYRYTSQSLEQEILAAFEFRMRSATQSLTHRLNAYTEVLRGLQGYFEGSDAVNRAEFRRYLMKLDLQERYPGFRVIGFAPRVPAENRDRHMEYVRNDTSIDPSGYPHFIIRPAGDRAEYYPITFLQPMSGNEKAFGFDLGSEPERLATLQRARDSGEAAATGRIILVQDETRNPGFLLMLPIYRSGLVIQSVEQRRAAFIGVVYAAFVMHDLMQGIFLADLLSQNQLKIIDIGIENGQSGAAASTIFDSRENAAPLPLDSRLKHNTQIDVGGRKWTLEFQGNIRKAGARESFPLIVLFAGLSITLLSFGIIRSLSNARNRAQKIANDITQELQNSETRTRSILDSVLDGIITIDEAGIVATFSPSAERIFGYEAQEVIGQNVNMLMPEPYHSAHDGYLHNYTSTGLRKIIGIGREVTGQRKDGSTFSMDLAVTETVLHGQRMFTGIVRDITERKRTEDEQRKTSALQRAILDGANYSIISTSPEGIILVFNAAAERMLGYRAEEMIGTQTPAILHEPQEVVQRAHALSQELGREIKPGFEVFVAKAGMGSIEEHEWTYIRKDGSRFPVMLSVTALRDSENNITGYLGIGYDITERKQIERMKNEFISTVSHELRTPLTSIRGSLGLVTGGVAGDIPAQVKTLLDIAQNNAERLVRLINDILDIEKIESGKLEFHNRFLDLIPLMEQAIADNKAYGEQLGIQFSLSHKLSEAWVFSDSDRLLQVMANLLSNAAKFSPRGETVQVSLTEYRTGWVRVSVEDHGPGIPLEFHGRMFEKFAQADSSDTRQKGGTGLGLSITRALLKAMNGTIDFVSTPGIGTTFYFDLPLQASQKADDLPLPVRHRILICEQDPALAALLGSMLEAHEFLCKIAHDANEAKQCLDSSHFDALILNLAAPGQEMPSLVREIRTLDATRQLPIIVCSAHHNDGKLELENTLGDWIRQPIGPARLLEVLHNATSLPDDLPSILHVEDDADIRHITASMLQGKARLTAAQTLAEAGERLARQHFDLVILDIGLPDGSGLDLLPQLSTCSPTIPLLIFSAQEVGGSLAANALLKSRTSNEQLLDAIRSLVRLKA